MTNDNYANQLALRSWLLTQEADTKENEQVTGLIESSVEWYTELLNQDKFYEC